MKNLHDEMHNLFQVSKTLRFELQPIGKTEEYFKQNILENDEKKAQAYPFVKKYCDEVHKIFINDCLKKVNKEYLNNELVQYSDIYTSKEFDDEILKTCKNNLRKIISETFTKSDNYKNMLSEKILTVYAKELYQNDTEALDKINQFAQFSTYFKGYHETRANMYKNEEKHTSIAYRLIDENLPVFRNNIKLYTKFKEFCPEKIEQIKRELNIDTDILFTDIKQYSNCLTQADIETYNLAISGKSLENGKKIQGINEYINLYNQQNKDKTKLIKFKILYKQILSDTQTASFVIESIENDKQASELIKQMYKNIECIIYEIEFIDAF